MVFAYGLWPIAWIIVAAVFLYKLTVKSGQFEVIRSSVLSITDDQRLQVLLIGFLLRRIFLEGAAGFGAPVAITAALLVGLGFNPLYAAGLCLIANTAPVAFGALGIPIIVAGQVTGIDAFKIGAMTGRQLPLLSLFVPFWLVFMMDGLRGVRETWPAALVAGLSFAITQYFTSNFIGPELPDITSALASLISLTLFLKVWQPKRTAGAQIAGATSSTTVTASAGGFGQPRSTVASPYSLGEIIKAWSPFLILTVLVTIWTLKPFKAMFAAGGSMYGWVFNFAIPHLDQMVIKVAPIVINPTAIPAVFKLDPISATGTAIFFSALISMLVLKINIKTGLTTFKETLFRAALADPVHRHGVGIRVRHQLLGHVVDHGPGAGRHGRGVPVLLAVPGLAGCVPDRFRYVVQRPVQLAASHHRAPARRQRHLARRGQHQRRRDRQDDFATIDRGGLRGDRAGGQGIGSVPFHPQTQPILCNDCRPDHVGPGLLVYRHAGSLSPTRNTEKNRRRTVIRRLLFTTGSARLLKDFLSIFSSLSGRITGTTRRHA
nr:hypothetical protein GCM10020185_21060 [Pseudomonas brassicacearum subsp. brassicacearum]